MPRYILVPVSYTHLLRDDGILKVSRSIKENQYKICKMREELEKKLGREPDLRELSDAMDMPMEELAMTLESAAEVDSIYTVSYTHLDVYKRQTKHCGSRELTMQLLLQRLRLLRN